MATETRKTDYSTRDPDSGQDNGIQRPDIDADRGARLVFGLLGASPKKQCWRLFLSLHFDEYLEFSGQDVVYSQRLTEKESQVGGTLVWLKRDSNVRHVRTVSREAQVDFLSGDFSERFLRAAANLPSSPVRSAAAAFAAGGCHTGGDFDTLCAACTAVPTALVDPRFRIGQGGF